MNVNSIQFFLVRASINERSGIAMLKLISFKVRKATFTSAPLPGAYHPLPAGEGTLTASSASGTFATVASGSEVPCEAAA